MKKPQILKVTPKMLLKKSPAAEAPPPPPPEPVTAPPANGSGREWWAQRWIDVLESFGWRRRLERARNYLREGRVLSFNFEGAAVSAKVQGTAPDPYDVSLSIDPFTDEQWQYVIDEMSQRAIFAAKLLAGEMPQNIEEAFTASGLSLFPFSKFDIHSHCSCPDPVNPCKHIGAVYYQLGEHFSRDPFILFQLRGKTKQDIITNLRQRRSASAEPNQRPTPELASAPKTHPPVLDASFWQYQAQLDASLVVIAPPPSQETVLDVLGPLNLDELATPASQQLVGEYLQQVYSRVSQSALISAMMAAQGEGG
jgi:uncharacterized Zn finger protein